MTANSFLDYFSEQMEGEALSTNHVPGELLQKSYL